MRLKKEVVEAREKFVKKMYAEAPEVSVDTINASLKAEFGMIMAPKRILELKEMPPEIEPKATTFIEGKFPQEGEGVIIKNDAHFYNPRVAFLPLSKNLPISKEKLNIVLEDSDGNQKMHEG